MNASELAMKMLEYESLQRKLDALGAEIKAAVLEIKETQSVGLVKAKFTNGRRKLDYMTPGQAAPAEIIAMHTCHVPMEVLPEHDITDWSAVCKEAGIEPIVLEEGTPSVTIEVREAK